MVCARFFCSGRAPRWRLVHAQFMRRECGRRVRVPGTGAWSDVRVRGYWIRASAPFLVPHQPRSQAAAPRRKRPGTHCMCLNAHAHHSPKSGESGYLSKLSVNYIRKLLVIFSRVNLCAQIASSSASARIYSKYFVMASKEEFTAAVAFALSRSSDGSRRCLRGP